MRNKKNSSGMGLIEVLVAMALLGIVTVGVVDVISNTMKQQKGIQSKDQQRELTAEVKYLLSDHMACVNSFETFSFSSSLNILSIKDKIKNSRFTVGSLDKTKLLKIDSILLNNWVPDVGSTTNGLADLQVFLSKSSDTGSSKNIKPDVLTLKITKNAAGFITDCAYIDSTAAAISPSLWKNSAVNPNDIYYNLGNVGVGTVNPSSMFEVNGNISVTSNTQSLRSNIVDVLDPVVTAKLFGAMTTGNIEIGNSKIIVDGANGNIGFGVAVPKAKLDVAGEIKFGNTNAVCDSTTEGQQRYNFSSKLMEFCNGITWQPFQISKPVDCVGAFAPCNAGSKIYMVIVPSGPGGAACSNNAGDVDTSSCGSCSGGWSTCAAGSQVYTVLSNPPGSSPCSISNGAVQSCGSVPPAISCQSGWTISGADCVTPSTFAGNTCNYKCQGAGGCTSQPCNVVDSSCVPTFFITGVGTCNISGSPVAKYACPGGGTLSGSNCVDIQIKKCPVTHPKLNTFTGLCDL
jgi:prepilin-type N-terminal cleavage/methylation domain-containing protein